MKQKKLIKIGSVGRFIITFALTAIAVVLIGFAVQYFTGGI